MYRDYFKKVTKEYILSIKKAKKYRIKLYDAIIKYLLINHHVPSKCTEAAIIKEFNIPRGTTRGLLKDLNKSGIISFEDIGGIKPFFVNNLVYALDKGYTSFNREEFYNIFSIREEEINKKGYLPKSDILVKYETNNKKILRYIPYKFSNIYESLTRRFFSFIILLPSDNKSMIEFKKLLKNNKSFIILTRYKPEIHLLNYFYSMVHYPIHGIFSNIFLNIIDNAKNLKGFEDEIDEIIKNAYINMLLNYIRPLERFIIMIKEKGFYNTVRELNKLLIKNYLAGETVIISDFKFNDYKDLEKYQLHKECIWMVTLSLAEGYKVSKKLNIEQSKLNKIKEIIETLNNILSL